MMSNPAGQNGKGSKPRPFSVKIDDFGQSWDRIFGKKKEKPMPTFEDPTPEPENIKPEVAEETTERKIATSKPIKGKQCPHCATYNLIKDPDAHWFLLCKKCGWNGTDPYDD